MNINDNKNDVIIAMIVMCTIALAGFATMIVMEENRKSALEPKCIVPVKDTPGYYHFHIFPTNAISVSPTLVTFRN